MVECGLVALGRVSVRMLRHYDRLGLLRPQRVDPFSGYRSYGASQLDRANRLVALKDLGFTLEQGGRMLDDGMSSSEVAALLLDKAAAIGLPVIFDIDYRPYSWPSPEVAADVLSRAGAASDMIVGNDEEFGFMAGGMDKGLAKARTLSETGVAIVIYKMGEGGAVTFAGGEEIRTGIYPVTAVKPNGAGDSFMAGLLAGIADGLPLRDAILHGSACAAIVVSQPGCAPAMPNHTQLADFLARHSGPTEV